jgi:hypothetical protein
LLESPISRKLLSPCSPARPRTRWITPTVVITHAAVFVKIGCAGCGARSGAGGDGWAGTRGAAEATLE